MPYATSIRLPEELLQEAKSLGSRRGLSFNALVQQILEKEIAAEQEREMYEEATLLGQDADSNVNYALAAQSEIALRD